MSKRTLLMIPGPIEFDPQVMDSMGSKTSSHVAPEFIETFGQSIERMKEVWRCPTGQPFVVAGTGTFAMEMAAANLIEPGEQALVLSTGYFGNRYAEILKRYGAEVTVLTAELGKTVALEHIEAELKRTHYKLLTFTHVDTSTAVRFDPESVAALAAKYDTLSVLDGVCSVAGELIRQEEWGIDVVLTASQKAIGVPPGLALMVVSQRAISVWKNRKTLVANYYADWSNWLPIMNAYFDRKPSYFGTPPVNLVCALNVSLQLILEEGMNQRISRHRRIATAFRAAMSRLGLRMIPESDSVSANTLTACILPDGINGPPFLAKVAQEGVIIAGGLLKDITHPYFRVGHMGSVNSGDILATVGAIEIALGKSGFEFDSGAGVAAALGNLRS